MIQVEYYNDKQEKWYSAKFETARGATLFIDKLKDENMELRLA